MTVPRLTPAGIALVRQATDGPFWELISSLVGDDSPAGGPTVKDSLTTIINLINNLPAGDGGPPSREWYAPDMGFSAVDWPAGVDIAVLDADAINAATEVRLLPQVGITGASVQLTVETSAAPATMTLRFWWRAQDDDIEASGDWQPTLWHRELTTSPLPAWTEIVLPPLLIPAAGSPGMDEWQYEEVVLPAPISSGDHVELQLLLARDATAETDDSIATVGLRGINVSYTAPAP